MYVAKRDSTTQLCVRVMDRLEPIRLAGTEGGGGPFLSPDCRRVGFFADGRLKIASLEGGVPLTLCEAPESRGASWGSEDTIIFSPAKASGLWRISASGGKPEMLTKPDMKQGEVTHRWPEILPGGKAVLFAIGTAGSASYDEARIAIQWLETGEQHIVLHGGTHTRYVPTGHLIFVRAATLVAIPFDLARGTVAGPVMPLLEGVLTETTGVAQATFSATGSLVYVPGGLRKADRDLLWVGQKGRGRLLAMPSRTFEEPRLSPDGQRLALSVRGASNDIWLYEFERGTLARLTFEGDNFSPIWTPDGHRVTFSSNRAGPSNMFWTLADGGGGGERLLASEYDQVGSSWSPDGQTLAFTEYHPDTGADIGLLSLSDRARRPFLRTQFNEWGAMFSPDGCWLAYTSDESGRPDVYVQSFPGPGRKWQISIDGGTEPLWARDGGLLFYRNGDNVLAVALATKPEFKAAKPRVAFCGQYLASSPAYLPNYDVSPAGRRLLMIKESKEQLGATELFVVLGWFAELSGAK